MIGSTNGLPIYAVFCCRHAPQLAAIVEALRQQLEHSRQDSGKAHRRLVSENLALLNEITRLKEEVGGLTEGVRAFQPRQHSFIFPEAQPRTCFVSTHNT